MNLWARVATFLLFLCLCTADTIPTNPESQSLGIGDIPSCGLQCIFKTLPASGCSLDDTSCVCSNPQLAQTLSACMLANCTMADALGTVKVQANLCNLPRESRRAHMFVSTGIVYAIAIFLVALRIAGKIVTNRLSLDDWIAIAALLLLALPVGCVLAMTKVGFGKHLWNLEDGQLLTILRFFWLASSFYVLVLALIKVSLVYFYLEIFTSRQFRKWAYAVLAYISVSSLIIFFLTIFSCSPVSAFWNRDAKGKCLDVQALAYANSGSAIVQDVILLILPLVFVIQVQMEHHRKIAVSLMFAIGTFGCIATMVRLKALLRFKISLDPSWDYVPVVIWTELELVAGFACVSLPTIRKLVGRILPPRFKTFLSSVTRSSRSRSSPETISSQPRSWKKPASWKYVRSDGKRHDLNGGTDGMSLHSYDSRAPPATNINDKGTLVVVPKSIYSVQPFADVHDESKLLARGGPTGMGPSKTTQSSSIQNSRPRVLKSLADIGCLPDRSWPDSGATVASGHVGKKS